MKTISLTRGYSTIVDDDDFERFSQRKWHVVFSPHNNKPYAAGYVPGSGHRSKNCYLAREIAGAASRTTVDHINGNTLDNRKINLRVCRTAQNLWNRGKQKNNSSGFKGVHRAHSKSVKWCAKISANGKLKLLGTFTTKEQAYAAYKAAAIELHGEFARW